MDESQKDKTQENTIEELNLVDNQDFVDFEESTNVFPDHILCMVSEYLDHHFILKKLCLASRYFYISMQLRYKSLCIKHGVINQPEGC